MPHPPGLEISSTCYRPLQTTSQPHPYRLQSPTLPVGALPSDTDTQDGKELSKFEVLNVLARIDRTLQPVG